MPEEPSSTKASGQSLIDRLPSWSFLIGLGALLALLALVNMTGPGNFVDEYIWKPISTTGNYNPYNTVLLMVVLGLVLGWIYRLMAELNEKVDLELTVAVVPYLVWGSVYHVLEDADLFAPFAESIRAAGGAPADFDASCWATVQGGFLQQCFGVFFQTPIIYVMVTFVAVFVFWLGHVAKRISERQGPGYGLRFVTFMFGGLFALYLALWASEPDFIRFVANPVVALAGCGVGWFIVWRDTSKRGTVNPRWVMFAFSMVFLIIGLYYVFAWMTGGHDVWRTEEEVSWWVLGALILAPILVAWSSGRKGRAFSGGHPGGPYYGQRLKKPDKVVWALMGLVIVEGLALFASIQAFHFLEERADSGTFFDDVTGLAGLLVMLAIGPAAVLLGNRLAFSWARRSFGVHPGMVFFAFPVNLIMVYGQSADGLMTSVGIDIFGYEEKHVLPAFLIQWVDGLDMPGVLDVLEPYPTTLVMVPLKILIVLAVVWLIDLGQHEESAMRQNLVGLVKMAIIMVGLSPGVRDAVRLAMAV
ncbi:MAG: DUF63 family protein [Euryarchaeota archaeon]|nr:DUF63 family protein [Euryarchaeota archaeon]